MSSEDVHYMNIRTCTRASAPVAPLVQMCRKSSAASRVTVVVCCQWHGVVGSHGSGVWLGQW